MPESSNETEVDSVLSAIRRLIEEGRPEGEGSGALDRLVLTHALRVDASPGPLVLTAAPSRVPGRMTPLMASSDTLVLMSAMPAAVPAPLGSSDPVEAELAGDPGRFDAAIHEVPPSSAGLGPSDPLEAELSVDPGALEASLDPGPALGDLSSSTSGPTPDALTSAATLLTSDLPASSETAMDGPGKAVAEPHEPPLPLAPPILDGQPPQPQAAIQPEPSEVLSRIEAADPLPDGLPGQVPPVMAEPARSGTSDATPPAQSDPAVATQTPEFAALEAGTTGPVPPPSPLAPGPLPSFPDEAALRGLVAEILREELRGELGEKLTRNLRKLVRREVMQALSLREG